MNNLLVYQASAGSGKTFKLTENYLRLLFSEPYAYKRTLAKDNAKANKYFSSIIIRQ